MLNRRRLMLRAWHLYRTELCGLGCIYRNNKRTGWRVALKQAWAEEKAVNAAEAMPAEVRSARIALLQGRKADLCFFESNRRMAQEAAEIAGELRILQLATA